MKIKKGDSIVALEDIVPYIEKGDRLIAGRYSGNYITIYKNGERIPYKYHVRWFELDKNEIIYNIINEL